MADDWWDDLYNHDDGHKPPAVAGGGRLPDWRNGPIDLDTDTKTNDTPSPNTQTSQNDAAPDTDDDAPQVNDDTDHPDEPDTPTPHGYINGLRRATDHPGQRPTYRDRPPTSPRQAIADTWHHLPPRLRWLTYHATAAGAGWTLGAVDFATHVTTWIATNGLTAGQAWFWYAIAAACTWLYHWSRSRWLIVAWPCAIPLTSAITGALLYTPGT
jgi:hypothetical protein